MKRVFVLLIMGLVFAVGIASAEESQVSQTATVELFGGYSGLGSFGQDNLIYGWNGGLAWNFNEHFGVVADISGHNAKDVYEVGSHHFGTRRRTAMLGPQVSTSMGRFRPFAHLLFGADRFYAKANKDGIANTGGAGAFGVGLDVRLHRNLSVRLGQLDYIRSYHSGSGINAGRYSAGLVFCFGRK